MVGNLLPHNGQGCIVGGPPLVTSLVYINNQKVNTVHYAKIVKFQIQQNTTLLTATTNRYYLAI